MKKNYIFLFSGLLLGLASCTNSGPSSSLSNSVNSSSTTSQHDNSTSTSENISSSPVKDTDFDIICPQGAPAASLVRYADDDSVSFGQPADVQAALKAATKDFVVFDSVNGLKLGGNNYKLVRMVTFGNLYVMSTGNDRDGVMDNDDFIYSYGENLVPDKAFKAVYPGIVPDAYGSAVSDTPQVMLTGLLEGQKVDYVVSSYPPIFSALNNANRKTDLSIYSNVAEEFGKKFGTEGFPQAGLFIKASLEADASKKEAIESFLSQFDSDVEDLIAGGEQCVSLMNQYGDATKQQTRFGFNSNVIKGIQETNGLSFLSADKNPTVEGFGAFQSPLGISVTAENLSSYYPEN